MPDILAVLYFFFLRAQLRLHATAGRAVPLLLGVRVSRVSLALPFFFVCCFFVFLFFVVCYCWGVFVFFCSSSADALFLTLLASVLVFLGCCGVVVGSFILAAHFFGVLHVRIRSMLCCSFVVQFLPRPQSAVFCLVFGVLGTVMFVVRSFLVCLDRCVIAWFCGIGKSNRTTFAPGLQTSQDKQ